MGISQQTGLSLDPDLHNGNLNALWKWVCFSLQANNSHMRKINGFHQVMNFINDGFFNSGDSNNAVYSMLVHMDETAYS